MVVLAMLDTVPELRKLISIVPPVLLWQTHWIRVITRSVQQGNIVDVGTGTA